MSLIWDIQTNKMKKQRAKTSKKFVTKAIRSSEELADALGLSSADHALMVYKAELSLLTVKAIQKSGLTVTEIVLRSGVARSKVSAIKNGSLTSLSSELFVKILAACGAKLTLKLAS
jgi:predicted XRE-type DNA-binding protein